MVGVQVKPLLALLLLLCFSLSPVLLSHRALNRVSVSSWVARDDTLTPSESDCTDRESCMLSATRSPSAASPRLASRSRVAALAAVAACV